MSDVDALEVLTPRPSWELVEAVLEVVIARGEVLGYADEDYRAALEDIRGRRLGAVLNRHHARYAVTLDHVLQAPASQLRELMLRAMREAGTNTCAVEAVGYRGGVPAPVEHDDHCHHVTELEGRIGSWLCCRPRGHDGAHA